MVIKFQERMRFQIFYLILALCLYFVSFAEGQDIDRYEWYKKDPKYAELIHSTKRPYRIDSTIHATISEFVLRESLRFKIDMYRKLYNIDILYSHPDSLKAFYENPFILENPQLRGYRYDPVFEVENMFGEDMFDDYFLNLFDVKKYDRFIRDERAQSDTLLWDYFASSGVPPLHRKAPPRAAAVPNFDEYSPYSAKRLYRKTTQQINIRCNKHTTSAKTTFNG